MRSALGVHVGQPDPVADVDDFGVLGLGLVVALQAGQPSRPDGSRTSRTAAARSRARWSRCRGSAAMPVPAGMSLPMITFSLSPTSPSLRPSIAASVSTRVVSWNDAADSHESVASDAFVIPMSSGRPSAGAALLDETRLVVGELAGVGLLARRGSPSRPAPTRRRGAASGGRSPRRACRGSTRPARGTPSAPRRRGTAGSRGCP